MNQPLLNVLRGAASVGLVVLVGLGCSKILEPHRIDVPDPPPEPARTKYHCDAEVIDELDVQRKVYSYDDTATEGVVRRQCFVLWEELEDLEDVEDAWHRWLDQTIEPDGWCIVADTISCEEAGSLGEESCPEITLPDEARDFCAEEEPPCCVWSSPPEIDFEDLQEAAGMDNWTPVGFASPIEASGTLSNHCDREVTFRLHDGLLGQNPGDFVVLNNSCEVPEPPEDHPDGLTLNPDGSPGDHCTYDLRFTPSARGRRQARMDFIQADTSACTRDDAALFRGRGRAGTLSGIPEEICRDRLADGSCTETFVRELTNEGPGVVAVEAVDVTGNFELLSDGGSWVRELGSFELAPEEPAILRLRWCTGIAGDIDEDGTLTITSNAAEEQILVPLSRRTAGCP